MRDLDRARDTVLLAEVRDETGYVKHHKQKIALIFAGMRGLASRLRADGVDVRYVGFEDDGNTGSLLGEVRRALEAGDYERVVVTAPGEYRLMEAFEGFAATSNVPFVIRDDDRFLCTPIDFAIWAAGRKELRMELFYREMRKRYAILMEGDGKPVGGAWNFDKENRKSMPKRLEPPPHRFIAPNALTKAAIRRPGCRPLRPCSWRGTSGRCRGRACPAAASSGSSVRGGCALDVRDAPRPADAARRAAGRPGAAPGPGGAPEAPAPGGDAAGAVSERAAAGRTSNDRRARPRDAGLCGSS